MKLLELFDKNVSIKWEHESEYGGTAEFTIGETHYRFTIADSDGLPIEPSEDETDEAYADTWEISFSATGEDGGDVVTNTGTGNSILVYSTVFQCIRQYTGKFGSRALIFHAYDEGRQKLYARFVHKFLPSWTFHDLEDGTVFVVMPPGQQLVLER